MKRFTIWIWILFLYVDHAVFAQQPIYTLYYTHPLAVNPAFTGSAHQFRAGLNFRNQWTNYTYPLTSYSVFADHYLGNINSGVGVHAYTDQAGSLNYRTTLIAASYAYNAKLGDEITLKSGIQPVFATSNFDQSSLIFNDQITVDGPSGAVTQEQFSGVRSSYFNLHAGMLFTVYKWWFGLSGYNLLMPQAGMTSESKLPIGFGVQIGNKIEFLANVISRKEKKERFLMPHLFFSTISYSKQLYAGAELVYEPFCAGLTFRGNYFSSPSGTQNNSSAAISIGFRKKNVQSNYVYDIPISNKSGLLGPSHEISIRTLFKWGHRPSRRKIERLDLF